MVRLTPAEQIEQSYDLAMARTGGLKTIAN